MLLLLLLQADVTVLCRLSTDDRRSYYFYFAFSLDISCVNQKLPVALLIFDSY